MSKVKGCAFCVKEFSARVLYENELISSFISRPWFRNEHCLVIPNRHITTIKDLTPHEGQDIMREIGRLSGLLDSGFGTGVMQKYQPLQTENGIKVNHLHFHVFPRLEKEPSLFPVPQPNDFTGFSLPTDKQIESIKAKYRH